MRSRHSYKQLWQNRLVSGCPCFKINLKLLSVFSTNFMILTFLISEILAFIQTVVAKSTCLLMLIKNLYSSNLLSLTVAFFFVFLCSQLALLNAQVVPSPHIIRTNVLANICALHLAGKRRTNPQTPHKFPMPTQVLAVYEGHEGGY